MPATGDEDRDGLALAELRPWPRLLAEDDVGWPITCARVRRDIEPAVVDARCRRVLAKPDHIRDCRLVVVPTEEVPGQQAADHEQQKQEQPQPPVALRRRPARFHDLLLGDRRGGSESADHVVDTRRASAPAACSLDPAQPGGLLVRGQGEETIARLGDVIERGCDIRGELSTCGHPDCVAPSETFAT